MTRSRDYESRRRDCKQYFRTDVSGGNNSIAPNAKNVYNQFNYGGSKNAAVKQELEKHYLNMLYEAQREIDECPHLDILHMKHFLHMVMPSKYGKQIEQLQRRQMQGATYNVCIGNPDNNTSWAQTAVLNDQFLPPQAAMGG